MLTLTDGKPRVFVVDLKDMFEEFYENEKINWIFDNISLKDIITKLDNDKDNVNKLFLLNTPYNYFESMELDILMFYDYLSIRLDLILLLNVPFIRSYEELRVDRWLNDTTVIYTDS